MNLLRFLSTGLCLCIACAPFFANAEEVVLVRGEGGLTVTAEDVRQELLVAKPEVQANVMSRADYIQQVAISLYARRFLVTEALANGLDKVEDTAAVLKRARDKILAEAAVERRDGAAPDAALVEKLALAQYNAHPEKYMLPERARAAHILISKDKPDAKKIAQELREKLVAGANFEEAVEAYSDDPGSKIRAGDLGLFERGKMVKPFEDAVFALTKLDEYSDVVETEFGFHIIRLYGKFKSAVRPFSEVKDQIATEVIGAIAKDKRAATNEAVLKNAKVDEAAIASIVVIPPPVSR